jgi:hypothetical protein
MHSALAATEGWIRPSQLDAYAWAPGRIRSRPFGRCTLKLQPHFWGAISQVGIGTLRSAVQGAFAPPCQAPPPVWGGLTALRGAARVRWRSRIIIRSFGPRLTDERD